MSRQSDNQLIRLYRIAHRQQENYTTEAFAHVLLHLASHEPETAARFLDWLTRTTLFSGDTSVWTTLEVRTQPHSEGQHGIPDLRLQSETLDVIIEVKLDASLETTQLCDYWKELLHCGRKKRALVGLTGTGSDIVAVDNCDAPEACDCLSMRTWGEVAVELRSRAPQARTFLTAHVVEQFLGLLNYLALAPLQVRSGLSEELQAHRDRYGREQSALLTRRVRSISTLAELEHTERLRNLLLQMDRVLGASRHVHTRRLDSGFTGATRWIGFSINGFAYFFYLVLDEPEVLCLQRYDAAVVFDGKHGAIEKSDSGALRWKGRLNLLDPGLNFFQLDEARQEDELRRFFENSFTYVASLPTA